MWWWHADRSVLINFTQSEKQFKLEFNPGGTVFVAQHATQMERNVGVHVDWIGGLFRRLFQHSVLEFCAEDPSCRLT